MTLHLLGFLGGALGAFMLVPLLIALWDGTADRLPLALSSAIAIGGGFSLAWLTRHHKGHLDLRRAFVVVTVAWFMAGLLGSLPYYLSSLMSPVGAPIHFPTFADCFFESISGFSTTGSSVLGDIESVPRGLLFWRSLTHWLGGMGIIVLSIAILPLLGGGGMNLFKAEAPGGVLPDKLAPRIAETARSMWWVYILLTLSETFLLLAGDMSLFDALCHSFGTVATGGFSTKNASIAAFDSTYIDLVVTVFMFLAGVNFFLHYQAMAGKPRAYLEDSEFRFFARVLIVVTLLIFVDVLAAYNYDPLRALRDALFIVVSIATTTGFGSADFELWPNLSQFLILVLMVMGGSAGSTAGGSKCLRVQIFLKAGYRELRRILHPNAIIPVRLGQRAIPDSAVASVLGFLTCVSLLLMVATAALASLGLSLSTSFTAALTCIFNVGPGLGQVGPTENFGFMPAAAKYVLSVCMVMGRLEVYTVLVLLTPDFFRR